jgi:hypothetical protein
MTARVLLMRLSIRESARGAPYLSGFLGAARVVAFKAKEPDKFGNEQWEVYVAEPEPKDGQPRAKQRGQGTWDRSRDHDLPQNQTREHRNERRDPREDRIRKLSERFEPDQERGF